MMDIITGVMVIVMILVLIVAFMWGTREPFNEWMDIVNKIIREEYPTVENTLAAATFEWFDLYENRYTPEEAVEIFLEISSNKFWDGKW